MAELIVIRIKGFLSAKYLTLLYPERRPSVFSAHYYAFRKIHLRNDN